MTQANERAADGVHALPAREAMTEAARKYRDARNITPRAPLYHQEFGFYCLERWYEEGLPRDADLAEWFHYDPPAVCHLGELGWCEAAFSPAFEVKVLEDRGEHEVVQDHAGRQVLFFKGERNGFMPEYLDHPVKDQRTWEEHVKWRLDPNAPERYVGFEDRMASARDCAAEGWFMSQRIIGGYMYLRSLMGPEDLLYVFCEKPDLVHDCMRAWYELAEGVSRRLQEHVTFDEVFLAEDICFNGGPLISPEMMREFLFPYYQQLLGNIRSRQIDQERPLHIQIDTDGFADPVIPVYQEIGMDAMSPFEVASGCDVLRSAAEFPDLYLLGGMDKRVLATTKEEIDAMVERLIPPLRERGGYTPTCDHGVPAEVSLENYMHYRKRCVELGG